MYRVKNTRQETRRLNLQRQFALR